MLAETTYTALRQKLAGFLDRVTNDREILIVRRRGARDVAIVPADELVGLMETAHLLRSPANSRRLFEALAESVKNDKRAFAALSAAEAIGELRRSVGLESVSETRS